MAEHIVWDEVLANPERQETDSLQIHLARKVLIASDLVNIQMIQARTGVKGLREDQDLFDFLGNPRNIAALSDEETTHLQLALVLSDTQRNLASLLSSLETSYNSAGPIPLSINAEGFDFSWLSDEEKQTIASGSFEGILLEMVTRNLAAEVGEKNNQAEERKDDLAAQQTEITSQLEQLNVEYAHAQKQRDLGHLRELANQIVDSESALGNIAEKLAQLDQISQQLGQSVNKYAPLRQAITEQYLQTGGLFVSLPDEEALIETKSKAPEIPYGDMDAVSAIMEAVIHPAGLQLATSIEPKRKPFHTNWDGMLEVVTSTMSAKDAESYIQNFRFAVRKLIEVHPDLFRDCFQQIGEEVHVNYARTFEVVFALKTDHLHEAFQFHRTKISPHVSRILSIVYHQNTGEFRKPEEFADLALAIANGEYPDCYLTDLLQDLYRQESPVLEDEISQPVPTIAAEVVAETPKRVITEEERLHSKKNSANGTVREMLREIRAKAISEDFNFGSALTNAQINRFVRGELVAEAYEKRIIQTNPESENPHFTMKELVIVFFFFKYRDDIQKMKASGRLSEYLALMDEVMDELGDLRYHLQP